MQVGIVRMCMEQRCVRMFICISSSSCSLFQARSAVRTGSGFSYFEREAGTIAERKT